MYVFAVWFLLLIPIQISKQDCSLSELKWIGYKQGHGDFVKTKYIFSCDNTSPENFLYDFSQNNDNIAINEYNFYNLTITNSEFVHIHSFLPPFPREFQMREFALINSETEFIEDWAFENLIYTTDLALSNNKLRNISFVSTLPRNLNTLYLNGNNFEVIENVFSHFISLGYLDLSNCKINRVDANSFSSFFGKISINLRNNNLTSFSVDFKDDLRLEIDLSLNNIKSIDCKEKRIYFHALNASHNQIQNISDISCQDCGYGYYRSHINFIDLSFNDLKNVYLNFVSGVKMENLNLSNSNIDQGFNFEILKYVKNIVDLSNNQITEIKPNIFGYDLEFHNLLLFNSSIKRIHENAFRNFKLDILNLSSNLLKELLNYTFSGSSIYMLDISNCQIQKIHSNAFYNLDLKGVLDLSHNKITYFENNVFENLLHVTKIDLSFNSLKKLDNNLFLNCSNLRILILSDSNIEIIRSHAFAGTNSLSELHLQNNLINKIDFKSFNVPNLINLQNNKIANLVFWNLSASFVILSGNNLTKLVNNSAPQFAPVKELDLSKSNIYEIDVNAFQGLNNLEVLNLSDNCIEQILPGTFFPLKKLIKLDFSRNKIRVFSKTAFAFGNQLRELSVTFFNANLTTNIFISLNYLKTLNILDSRLISMEANCFKGLIHLENLNLFDVEIIDISPGILKWLNNLQKVDFQILFKNLNILKKGIFGNIPKIVDLDLSNLEISSMEEEAFADLINLDKLFLVNNKLKKIVNGTFLGLESLSILNLSRNQISALESESFVGLRNLRQLFLINNNLTVLHLGTFQQFPLLKMLSLRKNNINKLLTGTFSNLKLLDQLDLAYNNITKLKMQNFMSLTNLRVLDLTANNLIQMSHLDLIKSLRQLEFIGLYDNKWKCDNLASMLIAFQNDTINWVSNESVTFTQENIDGIKCYDICKFFYCVEEEEILWGAK